MMCNMNTKISWLSLFLVFPILHQSQSTGYKERFESQPPQLPLLTKLSRNPLYCYSTGTLDLLQNLKQVVSENCFKHEENEFRFKVNPEQSFLYQAHIPGVSMKKTIERRKKMLERIASVPITKIQRCLSTNCSSEKQQQVEEFIQVFRKAVTLCEDSEYLGTIITNLEQTCK
ncbi:uncharacterized protein LOC135848149 [Planococcus citri]|uniref:uncharacterized protein LOC135848149 n=1 Tax=Planococcus citri TaxID=170843 RepID=UPI0031F7FDE8